MPRSKSSAAWGLIGLAAAITLFARTQSVTVAQEDGAAFDPLSPEARAAERAARRAERNAMQLSPEARETARAARREEMRDLEQAVEIRDPLPLPVEVRNAAALFLAGKPVGGACPGTDVCALRATTNGREALIVTAVWSATRIQCDALISGSPATGAVVAPWWRCQRELVIEGPGAGYAGFSIAIE